VLGVASLRDATLATVRAARAQGHLDPADADRAEHVVGEIERVREVVGLLRDGRPEAVRAVGPVLTASHLSLRDLMTTSCAELDAIVSAVLAAGALGARIVGGGFGGSAVVLCDATADRVAAVSEAAAGAVPGAVVRPVAPAAGVRRVR
jgi:galactokinase